MLAELYIYVFPVFKMELKICKILLQEAYPWLRRIWNRIRGDTIVAAVNDKHKTATSVKVPPFYFTGLFCMLKGRNKNNDIQRASFYDTSSSGRPGTTPTQKTGHYRPEQLNKETIRSIIRRLKRLSNSPDTASPAC